MDFIFCERFMAGAAWAPFRNVFTWISISFDKSPVPMLKRTIWIKSIGVRIYDMLGWNTNNKQTNKQETKKHATHENNRENWTSEL